MVSESGIMGRDPYWKYCTPMEWNNMQLLWVGNKEWWDYSF